MNSELEAIRDSWDKNTGDGRDESGTRALCDSYVAAHQEEFSRLREMSIDECVRAVGTFRQAGFEEEQWKVEVWLLHHFEPQAIGGPMEARVRLPEVTRG